MFEQGDLIWINFDPQAGHEQKGRRPAIVVSKTAFNKQNVLTMVCPITNTRRGYPTEVPLPNDLPITGVVLCDQARFLDLKSRDADFILAAPYELIRDVSEMIIRFIEIE